MLLVVWTFVTPTLGADPSEQSPDNSVEAGYLWGDTLSDLTTQFPESEDLDGYLLIGDDSDIDGSYLPRNYDNEIPNQNADLPIRRS